DFMDNFNKLNELISYIENNLDKELDNEKMAQILCVNTYTLYRVFMFVTGISLTEYIRNRKLSQAGIDILNTNEKIIDLAIKYGYNSADGFSRAFSKFHGISPTEAKKVSKYLKNYPPYSFSNIKLNKELNFKIEHHNEFILNGIGFECKLFDLHLLAPKFWDKMHTKFNNDTTRYGVIKYDDLFPNSVHANYYVASKDNLDDSVKLTIPESDWAIFDIEETTGDYFYEFSQYVYSNWIPFSGYNIRNIPEIEVYYSNSKNQWWLPIEKPQA
ncbi:MAG: AraC family transcriptional regulator, partial [Clostridia bacterium]|nr:AraC family transcriptional regulator [Clostridia bacterium]